MTRTRPAEPPRPAQPAEPALLRGLLKTPAYRRILLLCALVGIPVSLVCFWFLAGMHELQRLLWKSLPHALGWDGPPWWWPLPLLLVAGAVVGLVAARLPGAGGHIPAAGLAVGGASTKVLPGVLIAAVASLPLGAVLGPEAPLIALGSGFALLLRDLARGPVTPQATVLMGVAGAAAAIAAIFGSPLIAAVLLIEVVGVGGPQLVAVMLPALLSSGVGALVFTGFGRWTGLQTGGLSFKLPGPVPRLDAADVGWALLVAVLVAAVLRQTMGVGRVVAAFVAKGPVARTMLCALGAGGCAAVYALATGRSPVDVASSGQATMAALADDPRAWGVGALVAVLLCKTVGYALCLGSLRGGPIFPALFLGAAAGVLASPLPGLGVVPAVAAGLAAAAASVLRLPVSSAVMAILLIGSPGMTPVVILAAIAALITTELLPGPEPRTPVD
ncbi:chloride channel protein [Streptomyces sp. NBC_00091]|uniref:chloride channel protein n=1 Tax=Streptomyces sp. NBC_00091 TaxID=2975648 RepID=UPI00224D4A50|nr:chloride channel protein [Streptomyces sp. NBC_00091]MCX5377504.1 chloride channel protein [Streptomyces sp. NBC_00091]